MSPKRRQPKGITLLLAVMIMSSVVAIGVTLSTVLVFQVRINAVVKEGHQGYYATESGMELGLNKLNALKSGLLSTALGQLQTAALPISASIDSENTSYFYPGTSLLSASAQVGSEAAVYQTVKENQSIFVELYNVDDSLNTTATDFSSAVVCIYADGAQVGASDSIGNEVLEVSWVAWDTSLNLSRTQKVLVSYSKFHGSTCPVTGSGGKGFAVPILQFYPAFNLSTAFAGFRIRITPLRLASPANGDVSDFHVYTNPKVTSQIQIKSISSAAGQKQALAALFPWSLPLSGLFDFLIFSDETIKKEIPIQIANELKRYGPFAAADGGPTTISPADAFTDCAVSPCTYYVRLISLNPPGTGWLAKSNPASAVNFPGATGTTYTIKDLYASSCIISTPYVFSSTSASVTFTNKPDNLDKYELLTRPAFSTADENYCP